MFVENYLRLQLFREKISNININIVPIYFYDNMKIVTNNTVLICELWGVYSLNLLSLIYSTSSLYISNENETVTTEEGEQNRNTLGK